jgi:uncharacterized RDD family membrane protein YckC
MAQASKLKGLQGQYAGFVSRAIAFVLDILIVIAIIAVINGTIALTLDFFLGFDVASCPPLSFDNGVFQSGLICHVANLTRLVLTFVAAPIYFGLFWTLGGQTLGQYAMGLRVVRLDGKRMTFWRSLVRWIGYFVSFLALGIGYLWVLWDDRRQGFMDKLAKTVVVYSWEAKQNEFLLDRIRQKLRPKRKQQTAMAEGAQAIVAKPVRLELVLAILPSMGKVRDTTNVLQDAVRNGVFQIVSSAVMVKDETGALGHVGSSDLAAGDKSTLSDTVVAGDPRLKQVKIDQLMADVPNGSFILLIVVEDKSLTPLLKTLTAAKVAANVFDLDTPGHEPMTIAPTTESAGMHQALLEMEAALVQVEPSNGIASESLSAILTGTE